jgi:hypothetical protein
LKIRRNDLAEAFGGRVRRWQEHHHNCDGE